MSCACRRVVNGEAANRTAGRLPATLQLALRAGRQREASLRLSARADGRSYAGAWIKQKLRFDGCAG